MSPIKDRKTPIGCVFLVGCPRSGTTLLQSLLASHPKILSFPESKFFVHMFPQLGESKRRYRLGLAMRRTRSHFSSFLDEIECSEMQQFLPSIPLISLYTGSFLAILNRITANKEKTLWLEKTPEHLHYIPYIERAIPQAKFIHIVRNGADVVASLYDLVKRYPNFWGKYYENLDACINRWILDIKVTQNYQSSPRHITINYDSLVQSPEEELKRLLHFLGLTFDSSLLDLHKETSRKLIREREGWKSGVSGEIINANSKKFYSCLALDEQQYVLSRLAEIQVPAT